MRTRKMEQELERQINNLAANLAAQRLQIAALEEARKVAENKAQLANDKIAALQAATTSTPTTPGVARATTVNDTPRIPDLIRLVPEFNGDPRNLPRWIESVEQKLNECKKFVLPNDIPQMLPIWMDIIRDKLTEKANDALSASHTPLEWDAIKTTLIEYFGDKSDLSSLVSRLTNLKQGSDTVMEFYHKCRSLLAEINAKITLNNNTTGEAKAIMGTYETLMINAFVDGLHDTVSDLTRSTRPKSLTIAYQVASEQEAAMRRRREKNSKQPPDVLKTKQNVSTMPFRQQKPFLLQGQYPSQFNSRPTNFMPYASPQYRASTNYQQPRPINQNPNPQLALKQEPSSHQTRMYNKPAHNIHMHEHENYAPTTSTNYMQYHDYEPRTDLENDNDSTPMESNETPEELNFCTALDHQIAE